MLVPSIYSDLVNSFFGDFGDNYRQQPASAKQNTYGISTDVKEYDDHYKLYMELPGYDKQDIKVELKDGYLSVSAKHTEEAEKKDDGGKYVYKECTFGQCKRTFYVGKGITKEQIHAAYENGVLKLNVPKEDKTQKVEENHFIQIEG